MENTISIYSKLHSIKSAWIKLQRDTKAFNYKYATLSQIQEKLWDALQEQWLVVIHSIINGMVRTEVRDTESDQFVVSEIEMTTVKPQNKGSEITYYRRYNLLSLLDLEVEDDDGKKAQDSEVSVSTDIKTEEKNWLNYENFVEIVEAGNTTGQQITSIIKESWYTVSQYASKAIQHFLKTGEIDKNLFYKQSK